MRIIGRLSLPVVMAAGVPVALAQQGPPPPPPSFAGAHAGMLRQPDRVALRGRFECDASWTEIELGWSPRLASAADRPSVRIAGFVHRGKPVAGAARGDLDKRLAEFATAQTIALSCGPRPGVADQLIVIGEVAAGGQRVRRRVAARIAEQRVTDVTASDAR